VPSPVDINPVPFVRWLVASCGLVCAVTRLVRLTQAWTEQTPHRFVLYLTLWSARFHFDHHYDSVHPD
jgi:hypothetical protein